MIYSLPHIEEQKYIHIKCNSTVVLDAGSSYIPSNLWTSKQTNMAQSGVQRREQPACGDSAAGEQMVNSTWRSMSDVSQASTESPATPESRSGRHDDAEPELDGIQAP